MAITIKQPGAAKAAAAAGTAIGKGQRAEEDRARAEREQARAQQQKAQQAAQQKAMEFDLFKMEQRSLQDFQQELRDKQYEFDKFNRAKEWDVEKMELASRMDFQQDETKRLQEMDRVDSKLVALNKAKEDGQFTGREFEFENMRSKLEQQRFGIKNPSNLPQPVKPRSAVSQASEIEATMNLEGYTAQDLQDLGLDPADFPGVAGSEVGGSASAPAQIEQIQQSGGQVVENKQTGEVLVSYDDGDTWEPLDQPAETEPSPTEPKEKKGILGRAYDLATYKPFSGRKAGTANFGFAGRNR